jgi:hypothetical protein
LGQTSPNPVLSTLKNFRNEYEALIEQPASGNQPGFDILAELSQASALTGRQSVHFKE